MDGRVLNTDYGFKPSTDDVVEQMLSKAHPLPVEAFMDKPINKE